MCSRYAHVTDTLMHAVLIRICGGCGGLLSRMLVHNQ